jgi:tryptophan-rich sensory protein
MSDSSISPVMRARSPLALAGFLAAAYLVAGVSSIFTISEIPAWYAGLAKPSFNPPNQLFGPVWTLLYTLMAIAAWLVWRRPGSGPRKAALWWWAVQLALNFGWSLIFFRQHRIGLALVEIFFLWLAIAITMALFFRLQKTAGWLMVPYLAWVSFAGVLNFAIWRIN